MDRQKRAIGIIGSMDVEISHYLKNSELKRETSWNGITFYETGLFGKKTVVGKSGVCKVFAAMVCERLIDEFDPGAGVFTGVAGALNRELDIGDVVRSRVCIQYDLDAEALGFPRGEIPYTHLREFKADEALIDIAGRTKLEGNKVITGTILTGDQFMTTKETNEHKYLTEELHKIPFIIVRTVSDRADGTAAADFNKFLPLAARNSFDVVKNLLLNY